MGLNVTIGQQDKVLFAGGAILHLDSITLAPTVVKGRCVRPDGSLQTFQCSEGDSFTVYPGVGVSLLVCYYSKDKGAQAKFSVHAPKAVQVQRAHTSEGPEEVEPIINKFYFDDIKKFYRNLEVLHGEKSAV